MAFVKSTSSKLKEGRGKKRGDEYIPWLKVREVPSKGRVHRCYGLRHNRVYHFMSDLEYYYALLLSWDNDVLEIREQFPLLPLKTTKRIALELGYNHPAFMGKDVVMTTDFVITLKSSNKGRYEKVRTLKYSTELSNKRTLEKLSIEKKYFKEVYGQEDWGVITERGIDIVMAKNLDAILPYQLWDTKGQLLSKELENKIHADYLNLFDICNSVSESVNEFAVKNQYNKAEAIKALYYLIANKKISVDLKSKVIRSINDLKLID